ncbi:cation-transporting P-type ATPase, partial [Halochromatium sp.]
MDTTDKTVDWHALDTDAVLLRVNSTGDGLKQSEAERRLADYGPNKLPEAKPRSPLMRFLAQFHNVLIYVLIVAGVVTALLQHWLDAGVIFGVVLINAIIGFVQEGKAEDALEAILGMLAPRAAVTRGGKRATVPAE